jgi:hypothetical protein
MSVEDTISATIYVKIRNAYWRVAGQCLFLSWCRPDTSIGFAKAITPEPELGKTSLGMESLAE